MELAIVKNFEREATTISSKASIPWFSNRVSTEPRGSELAELQAFNRSFLFCLLKTVNLWTAGAPVRPPKLADLDAYVVMMISVSPMLCKATLCPRRTSTRNQLYVLFSTSRRDAVAARNGGNPIARYS